MGRGRVDMYGLEERLRRLLGLSGYEARAYLAVLRGASRPKDVAREAGIPLQRVYDVLARLEERGLVARTPSGGYAVVEPKRAMEEAAGRVLAEARAKAEELRALGEILEREARGPPAGEEVRLVRGLSSALASAFVALRSCSGMAWFTVYKAAELGEMLAPQVLEALSEANAKARVLVSSAVEPPRDIVETLRAAGVELRRSPAALLDMMVACDTVVIGLPSGGDVVAVVVRNGEFAGSLEKRLREAWLQAEQL